MRAVDVAVALVWQGGRLFLQRRDPHGAVLPGCWELPGGKVEPGESPGEALRRELKEEVGLDAAVLRPLPAIEHAYPDRRIRLHPFLVQAGSQPRTALAWGWFTPEEALNLPLPEANLPLIRGLRLPGGEPSSAL
jgi:8-oxo-dGTP diphosphatase